MRQVRIAELKAKLSEYLRAVQNGESFSVLDRNTAIAQMVPVPGGRRLKIRRPAAGAPTLTSIPVPAAEAVSIDALELLREERQHHR